MCLIELYTPYTNLDNQRETLEQANSKNKIKLTNLQDTLHDSILQSFSLV